MHRIYEKYEIYRIKHDPTSTIGRFNPGYTVDWSPSILCIFNSIRCQLQSHRDHWKIIHSLLSMTKVELSVRITRSKYYSKKKFIRIIRLKEIKIFIRNCNDNFFLFWKFLFSHLFVISCNWTEVDTRQQWIIDSDEFKSNSFFFFVCSPDFCSSSFSFESFTPYIPSHVCGMERWSIDWESGWKS